MLTLRDPGSLPLVSLLLVLSSLVGGNPLGVSALRLAEGEGALRRWSSEDREESVSLLPWSSGELSDVIMAYTQGLLSSVPVDAAEVAVPLT